MDPSTDPLDSISAIIQENLEIKARMEAQYWELRSIKASTTYAASLRLQKMAARMAAPKGRVSNAIRKLLGVKGPREPVVAIQAPCAVAPAPPRDGSRQTSQPAAITAVRPPVVIRPAPGSPTSPPVNCFTTLTASQIPKARVLAKSLKLSNPGWKLHAVMPEPLPASINPADEPFDSILTIDDLEIDNRQSWLFKHSVVEAANAVKGAGAKALFKRDGMDRLIYLDADIAVFGSLSPIARLLDEHPIILTPHACQPETDAFQIRDKELPYARFGAFNLGFFAIRADGQGSQFLQWWWARLRDYCYIEMKDGLFVDQRWCDLAPMYFDKLYILRDTRYNVASWNLTHRVMSAASDGTVLVDGQRLGFFHFSGYDSGITPIAIRKSVRDEQNVVYDVLDWYNNEVSQAGQETLKKSEWAYNRFSDGRLVSQAMRIEYRSRPELQAAYPDPFDASSEDSFRSWWDTGRS